MKTGRANRWATREFEQEAKAGQLRFIDWLDFEEEFRKDFMPLDSESAAINVLETTAARFAHSNPSPGNPVPMDIDTARKTKAAPDTCRHCGRTGHWAKDCDLWFDVRYMDTDELERELENKFAAKDVASAETPCRRRGGT